MSLRPSPGRAAVLGVALAAGGAWQGLVILVFLAAVLWAEDIAQAAAKALRTARDAVTERATQRRELNHKRLELEAALARQTRPSPCAHERPEDVRDLAGTLVARLYPKCLAQLPPDFETSKQTGGSRPRP